MAVVFDGFLLLDLAGPLGALEVANAYADPGYTFELVSVDGGLIRSSAGIHVDTRRYEPGRPADLLIVPGGVGTGEAVNDLPLVELIRRINSAARTSASVCSGAFLLAAAGILDGRRATTHWDAASFMQAAYPEVVVDSDCIFIEDGNVWTSAGITAGVDLALAIIERDYGLAAAQRTAQGLVVYHRRRGGQKQFSASLRLQSSDDRFAKLLDWARERLHEGLEVDRLAEQCSLSPRQFSRAFTRATGLSPGKAIEQIRVDRSRSDVLAARDSLESVARRFGFGSAARMRRSFLRILGQSPQNLRHAS